MAAVSDAHVGVLLLHLNELRHPTLLEQRLMQVEDEYHMLRSSSASLKNQAKGGKSTISLDILTQHLRDVLEASRVIVHEQVPEETADSATFGEELLHKQLRQVIDKLNSTDKVKRKKAIKLLDSLITTEVAVKTFCASGGLDELFKLFEKSTTVEILHIIADLSAFEAFRSHPMASKFLEKLIPLLRTKDEAILEMTMWALANFCVDSANQIPIGKETLHLLIDLLLSSHTGVQMQALKCLTNLAMQRANRKVIDAWDGFGRIVNAFESKQPEVSTQALWALAQLASLEIEPLFLQYPRTIKTICQLAISDSTPGPVKVLACRCAANLCIASSKLAKLVLSENVYEGWLNILNEVVDSNLVDDPMTVPLLEEVATGLAALYAREPELAENVTVRVVQWLVCLMSVCPSTVVHEQAAWALARITGIEKNQPKFLLSGGLEITIKFLSGETHEQLPAAFIIANLANNVEISDKIREIDGLLALVKLLYAKDQDVRLAAAKALSVLSNNSKNKALMRHLYIKLSQKDNVISHDLQKRRTLQTP